ncbi:hypothetical protein FH972_027217 [Carpinus fangiana]|uniref:O-methyltransferase C-terminal domain-containing protein n=1 Tax=Carpinus fangiana TaxID=176857 RepID=A0A5N6L8T3_9ROSI|nr:hypothetical protein FH972_027217 [Carpinus fangiana]
MKDVVLEGGSAFEKAHGMPFFEYTNVVDLTLGEGFDEAMGQQSILVMKQILKKYKGFEGLSSLVDVGGGVGSTLNMIVSDYPSIKGINFDLPGALRNARSYKGIEHVGGNMFEEVPKGDAIMLKQILHNWEDEECVEILRNCYKALGEGRKVIVINPFAPPVAPETTVVGRFASQCDSIMFSMPGGGKERTEMEFKALALAAGFAISRVACSACGFSVMEFTK